MAQASRLARVLIGSIAIVSATLACSGCLYLAGSRNQVVFRIVNRESATVSGLELREGNQKWTRRVPPIPPGGAVSIEVTGAFSPEEGAVRIVDTRHRLEYTVVEYYESELVGRVDVVLTGVTDDGTLVIRALDGAGFMHEEAEWVTSTPEPSEESSAIAEPSVIGSAGPVHP